MIGIAMYTTILTLHKQGRSQRQISKLVEVDRKTVGRIIKKYKDFGIEEPAPMVRKSQLSAWHEDIVNLLEKDLSYVRIFEELQSKGYKGGYSTLRRYVGVHRLKTETCIRFHSLPGEEAQVDFGDIGKKHDSEEKCRKAYIFNMRLSHSRLDYYEVVFDQKVATWLKCHINAFEFFGGVPEYVKLDNLKAGILKAEFFESTYQREYKRLADHYGFSISPCRVAKPQEKGKVESGIKYVKNNFFAGREFANHSDMVAKLIIWIEKANSRKHGTTKKVPQRLFEEVEKGKLIMLPDNAFDMASWHIRKVAKDCHITIENNYYSVPSKYVGTEVGISLSPALLRIYSGEEMIGMHTRSKGSGVFSTVSSHYAKGKRNCPGFKEYDEKLESKIKKIGHYGQEMLSLLKKVHKRNWYQPAKGILFLRKTYKDEEINKALERAVSYGVSTYSKIKNILSNNCHKLPIPDDLPNYEGGEKSNKSSTSPVSCISPLPPRSDISDTSSSIPSIAVSKSIKEVSHARSY